MAMLSQFLVSHRTALIDRCRSKVLLRATPTSKSDESERGIPEFLDQLVATLQFEHSNQPLEIIRVSGRSGGEQTELSEMGVTAAQSGRAFHRLGYTLDQVVHNYGDFCQAVTELASELKTPIDNEDFRTLNRCLDNVIAAAVTEFAYQRDVVNDAGVDETLNEKIGSFAHELRNHLQSMALALAVIKSGTVGLSGATGRVLDRSLAEMQKLIDHTLLEARTKAGMLAHREEFSLAEFIADLKLSSELEAHEKKCNFRVSFVDPGLAIEGSREMLLAAVWNLLQNAFKFTHTGSEVALNAYAVADRVLIEVEDRCGGLPAGAEHRMFLPYVQAGANRSGLGLGLSIAKRTVECHQGTLTVRDIPGIGCIFIVNLARHEHSPIATTTLAAK